MSDENAGAVRYKFAFIVDGDVGMVLWIPAHEEQDRQVMCLRSNPEIVEVEPSAGDIAKFNFINDGVVNYTMDFSDSPVYQRCAACLRSNPVIMEVPDTNPVRSGWTYDGTTFNPPA